MAAVASGKRARVIGSYAWGAKLMHRPAGSVLQACGCVLPAAIVRRTPFDLHQLHSSQLTALPSASLSSHSAPSARTFSTSSALHDASKGQPKDEDATCTTSEASASPLASSHSSFPSTSTREAPPASASAYLLAQAALEDAQDPKKALWTQIPEEEPWEGDEPQARAIRRILEDQYKPLRVKGYAKNIPVPAPLPSSLFDPPHSSPPASTSKNTWDYKFTGPSSASPLPTALPLSRPTAPLPLHSRLARAKEKSLDYGVGLSSTGQVMVPDDRAGDGRTEGRKAMGGMRAWSGFVEDKIETARRDGLFNEVKGRGKPMERDEAAANPFIARDEFLMNRIVQSQGVAPPWVELQQELESALSTFRNELRSAWVRRATRMKSLGGVSRATITEIREGWRDAEWEQRERSYHEVALASLNSIVRRYNGMAPYPVRRAPLSLRVELEACFRDSTPTIVKELQRRLDGRGDEVVKARARSEREIVGKVVGEEGEEKAVKESMWRAFKRVVRELLGVQEGKSQGGS